MKRHRENDHPENVPIEGRTPPHDLQAEAAVIAAVMLRGDVSAFGEVAPIMRAEDCYSEAHRRIFEVLGELAAKGKALDVLSVEGELADKDRLAQVGGRGYLVEILDSAPFVASDFLARYAARVASKARLRRLAWKLQEHVARCYAPVTDEGAEEIFQSVEREVIAECSSRHTGGGFARMGDVLQRVMKNLDAAAERAAEGKVPGISTGFDRFDQITGGLHDGDLTIVAARPGMGKTSLVLGFAAGVAERQFASAIFSGEMPEVQIGMRALFSAARVDLQKGRTGKLHPNDWSKLSGAASELAQLDIFVDDTAGITLSALGSKLRKLVADLARKGKRLGAVCIDYLQIMDLEEQRGETRDAAIGRMTRGLKRLAKELAVPILLLSQLNRGPENREDKKPRIGDLRESGSIENDADNIVFIYRDDYYTKEESTEPNVARLIIEKQRNGPTGEVCVGFDKQWTRFFNLKDYDDDEDPPAGRFDDEP